MAVKRNGSRNQVVLFAGEQGIRTSRTRFVVEPEFAPAEFCVVDVFYYVVDVFYYVVDVVYYVVDVVYCCGEWFCRASSSFAILETRRA